MSSTAMDWTEVARRTGAGVDAALLWSESHRRVKVFVSDRQLCHHIDFDVADAAALRAFGTSFAAMASRVPTDDGAATHELAGAST